MPNKKEVIITLHTFMEKYVVPLGITQTKNESY